MTSLLLWKEYLKRPYDRYSYGIQPMVRLLFALCTVVSLNTNIGYMAKFKSLLVILPICLISAFLPYGAIVFLAGCLMIAHVYAVSLEMAPIAVVLVLTIIILYYGLKLGDSYLMVLIPPAFLLETSYVVPLLVGLGGNLASATPVGYGVLLYYLLVHVKQNASILAASDSSADIAQKYSQIPKSMFFNQTVMIIIVTCAVGIIVVCLIHKLSMDYAWVVATVAGSVTEPLTIFVGDFVFEVSVSMGPIILGLVLSAAMAAAFDFFVLSMDYIRIEYVQFEDDDYYYYVKAVPKMAVSIPGVRVQKTNTHKRGTRKRNSY